MDRVSSEYQQLATSEESTSSLDRTIKLLMRIASGNGSSSKGWLNLLNGRSSHRSRVKRVSAAASRISDVSWALSKLPRAISKHFDQLPEDQYSLLIDTLLLVFHQAYFVLPADKGNDRHLLLKAFNDFAERLPRPQDQFQVRGLVEIEQKKLDAAVEPFRTALAATHADEHDFLTRVQIIWTILMERRLTSEAFNCLIDVYPRVARSDLGEVEAMLRKTFLEAVQRRAQ